MPPASTPTGVDAAGERSRDLHDRSVASEREHRVVVRGVKQRQLRGVAGTFGEHDVALHGAGRQRISRVLGEPKSSA